MALIRRFAFNLVRAGRAAKNPSKQPEERPEPEPPKPEPGNPYEAGMKARLARAVRSGAWMQVLQTDQALAGYVRSRLNDSS